MKRDVAAAASQTNVNFGLISTEAAASPTNVNRLLSAPATCFSDPCPLFSWPLSWGRWRWRWRWWIMTICNSCSNWRTDNPWLVICVFQNQKWLSESVTMPPIELATDSQKLTMVANWPTRRRNLNQLIRSLGFGAAVSMFIVHLEQHWWLPMPSSYFEKAAAALNQQPT